MARSLLNIRSYCLFIAMAAQRRGPNAVADLNEYAVFCCQFDRNRDWRGRIVRWDRVFGYHGSNCIIPCWQIVFHLLNRAISGAGAGGEARAENGNEGWTGRQRPSGGDEERARAAPGVDPRSGRGEGKSSPGRPHGRDPVQPPSTLRSVHSWEVEMASGHGGNGQLEDGKLRLSEDDIARALLGPRGVPGKPDTAKMTPQQEKNFPKYTDPGHTA